MNYPTKEEVQGATREQLARWVRFLPSPMNDEQARIMNYLCERFGAMGGMTPELSKKIGR